jgi:hypothetical protein
MDKRRELLTETLECSDKAKPEKFKTLRFRSGRTGPIEPEERLQKLTGVTKTKGAFVCHPELSPAISLS